jgi:hypothetical protein
MQPSCSSNRKVLSMTGTEEASACQDLLASGQSTGRPLQAGLLCHNEVIADLLSNNGCPATLP